MCQGSVHSPVPLTEETIASEQLRLRDILGERGHRVTASRLAIYDVMLRANDHICVEHILQALETRHASLRINKTTVYRTMELLAGLGLVAEMRHADGRTQYELTRHGPHGHLLCRECGRVQDVPLEQLRDIQRRLESAFGFSVELIDQALPGICSQCAALQSGPHQEAVAPPDEREGATTRS